VLYLGEIRKLQIHAQEDLPDASVRLIYDEILKKRSRLRCMNLLKTSDRTVGQLESRLRLDGYPEETIEQALSYVSSFHYTDDMRYAQNYIRQMAGRKSVRQIEYDLQNKGVDRDTVRTALEECEELNEEAQREAVLSQARKRGYEPEHSGKDETVKLIRSLRAKGFGMDIIRSALPGILDP
jgi:regulatory protein